MSVKAIIRGCRIDNAVRLWSRHATPQAFTHLIVSGPTGRAALNHLDPEAGGLFVFGHPFLGLWSAVPALFGREDGGVLHAFAGVTPDQPQDPADIVDPETGATVTAAQQFAAKDAVELYVLGHVERLVNGRRRDGQPFCGLKLTDTTLLDSIVSNAVVYRSDEDAWALVSLLYKRADGAPRVDPDNVRETAVVTAPSPPEIP